MKGRWDLMPESCRTVFNRRRRVRRWIVAYTMAGLMVGTTIAGLMASNASKQRERDALAAQVEVHWMRNEEARSLLDEIRDLESSIARFNRLAWPVRVSDAIGVIESIVPPSTTLTSLTLIPREETPRPAGKRRKGEAAPETKTYLAIEIEGLAIDDLDVAEAVRSLEQHRMFSGVNLDFARSRDVGGIDARAFRLSCEIDLSKRYRFVDGATASATTQGDVP
jgi:hypothetical protein